MLDFLLFFVLIIILLIIIIIFSPHIVCIVIWIIACKYWIVTLTSRILLLQTFSVMRDSCESVFLSCCDWPSVTYWEAVYWANSLAAIKYIRPGVLIDNSFLLRHYNNINNVVVAARAKQQPAIWTAVRSASRLRLIKAWKRAENIAALFHAFLSRPMQVTTCLT